MFLALLEIIILAASKETCRALGHLAAKKSYICNRSSNAVRETKRSTLDFCFDITIIVGFLL